MAYKLWLNKIVMFFKNSYLGFKFLLCQFVIESLTVWLVIDAMFQLVAARS